VRQGLEAAVAWGTAVRAQVPGLNVAGKTGTAEFCDGLAIQLGFCANGLPRPTHAWFTAYAPAENPQIALVVYIYNGGEGSQAAAPVAQKILQYWFERQSGAPATNSP
jgi:penicillin-binding protein 2